MDREYTYSDLVKVCMPDVADESLLELYREAAAIQASNGDSHAARRHLRERLKAIGYVPPEGQENTWQDLSCGERMVPTLDTISRLAWGRSNLMSQLDDALFLGCKMVLRGNEPSEAWWRKRWEAAADRVNWSGVARNGEMIALAFSPIWSELSDFGLPYPPFFMDKAFSHTVLPVRADECVKAQAISEEEADRLIQQRLAKG